MIFQVTLTLNSFFERRANNRKFKVNKKCPEYYGVVKSLPTVRMIHTGRLKLIIHAVCVVLNISTYIMYVVILTYTHMAFVYYVAITV